MLQVSRIKKETDAPEPLGVHEGKTGNDFGGETEFVFLKLRLSFLYEKQVYIYIYLLAEDISAVLSANILQI